MEEANRLTPCLVVAAGLSASQGDGDSQTEAPGVPAESGRCDPLLRRMLPYLICPDQVTVIVRECSEVQDLKGSKMPQRIPLVNYRFLKASPPRYRSTLKALSAHLAPHIERQLGMEDERLYMFHHIFPNNLFSKQMRVEL